MSGPIIRSRPSRQFAHNWAAAFGRAKADKQAANKSTGGKKRAPAKKKP
jgi:hypothetical protein